MFAATADLVIEGPGVIVRVHGDGPVLFADVRGDLRQSAHALRAFPGLIRFIRTLSRSLRMARLRIDVRMGSYTIIRLG